MLMLYSWRIQLSSRVWGRLIPDPMIPKSIETQVPYIKWHRAMHTVSPPLCRFPTTDKNTIFDSKLVESVDSNPADTDMEGQLY